MDETIENHLIQQFVDEQIFQIQYRHIAYNSQCVSQTLSCPSTFLLNLIDEPL
jgi:hypothetical protein